jgi:glycosyltransferase involved in cell wall biosynthesis
MISVVIPSYNKEAFIAEAIQSVLDQTFDRWELIVVDDASTDCSVSLINNFKDSRIRLIQIEKSGVSIARNIGIEASQYHWIALLDADDWWAPTFLEEMIECINIYPEQKLFASGRTHVFRDYSKRYVNHLLPAEGKVATVNFFEVLVKYLPLINSSNAVIEKSVLQEGGLFRRGQKLHEDHDLWMRLCLDKEVVFLNKNLSFYRNTEPNSASKLPYEPSDFCLFMKTLVESKKRLKDPNRKYFLVYCNRFVLLTYIKNYARYTAFEDNEVFALAEGLVSKSSRRVLKFLRWLPFKNTYPVFKLFHVR